MPSSPDIDSLETSTLLRSKALVLSERLLGLCDRTGTGQTDGCFDRYYWCYRLHDVANARFQEAVRFFAVALPQLRVNAEPALRQLVSDAVRYWASIRNQDGSLNEVYPYERSFCATAMSTQAVADAWIRLDGPCEIDFRTTSDWLMRNDNVAVANQMAGACQALECIANITGDEKYREGAREKFEKIVKHQLDSGCYGEYDGPDVGYATITLSLLAGYHRLTGCSSVMDSMMACAAYLDQIVDEDGLYDWSTTSRRTQFLYPFGLAYLDSPVFDRLLNGLEKNVVINPLWMDDRYCIPLGTDYLLAAEWLDRKGIAQRVDDAA